MVVEDWTGCTVFPPQGAQVFIGVCPTTLCLFCGLGECFFPFPSWHPVGGALGVTGQKPSVKG